MKLKKYKLYEIADLNTSSISNSDNTLSEIIYLDTSSITENVILSTYKVSIHEAPSRAQRRVKKNTILYSTVRPRLKHYGILSSPEANLIVSTGFVTIDVKSEFQDSVDARFLFLLLTQPHITEYIASIADSAVSAYPSFNPSDISALEFEFPEMNIQTHIADIWEYYDSKIGLNRQINDNLEAMAKQLYDYWFVQFDFPNEEGKPYKSSGGAMVYNERLKREIPVDWQVVHLIDFAEIKNGATPSTADDSNYGGDIVWITPKDLSDQQSKFVYQGERNITKQGFDSCSTSMIPINSVLMSSRAPIGLVSIAKHEVCTNQGFKSFIPKNMEDSIYLYYYIKHHIKQIEQLGTGTTFKEVSMDDLCKFPILAVGAKEAYKQWIELQNGIADKQLILTKEIEALTKQRDELLPLLMNGQASINYHLSARNYPLPIAHKKANTYCYKPNNKQYFHPKVRQPYTSPRLRTSQIRCS